MTNTQRATPRAHDLPSGGPVLVTGWADTHCRVCFERLTSAGVVKANPTKRTGYQPAELSRRMRMSGLNDAAATGRAGHPALAWQIALSDLAVENAHEKRWGWSDTAGLWTIEAWRSHLGSLGVVIVYGTPADGLADTLFGEGMGQTIDPQGATAAWVEYHRRVLDLARRDDVSLLHIDAVLSSDVDVWAELGAALGVDRPISSDSNGQSASSASARYQDGIIERTLAERFVIADEEILDLYQSLEAVASVPSGAVAEPPQTIRSVITAYRGLVQSDGAAPVASRPSACAIAPQDALEEETALLRAQLAQAHEELRTYFARAYNEPDRSASNERTLPAAVPNGGETTDLRADDTITLDLRGFVDGDGWYHSEEDGRWAGPTLTSTLRLPRRDPGRYRVEIVIVDAIADDIVKDMSAAVGDRPVRWRERRRLGHQGVLAPLRRLAERIRSRGRLAYPLAVTGTVSLTAFADTLSITVPRTVSPSSTGASDARELSIRVATITVAKARR